MRLAEPPGDGTTRCAVVGHPVGHSLSPAIHRAAYATLGLDWSYELHDLLPDEYEGFVASRDGSWRGLSVTMPHKEATARLGVPDADVRLTGVANTLVWEDDGSRHCHNTDIAGLVDAVGAGVHEVPRAATILGAGATATSAVVASLRLGLADVEILGRDPGKARRLAEWARSLGVPARTGDWGRSPAVADGLVLSTVPSAAVDPVLDSLGLEGSRPPAVVFDVIYDPWPTPLAARAEAAGLAVLSGLDLLVHQAVHQVRLMTGHEVAASALLSAARAELGRRQAA